jgi:ethanolamine utilization protein
MIITEELVSLVTGELLKRLGLVASSQSELESGPKSILLLVGEKKISAQTREKLSQSFEILEPNDYCGPPLPPKYTALLTTLGLQPLVRVAQGDDGCTIEGRVLLDAFLKGMPVAALEEGLYWKNFVQTAPPLLLNIYKNYQERLVSFGLKIVSEEKAPDTLLGKNSHTSGNKPPLGFKAPDNPDNQVNGYKGNRAITENEMKTICPPAKGLGQKFSLEHGSLLTPLAKDYISAMKIEICPK